MTFNELFAFFSVGAVVIGLLLKIVASSSAQRKEIYRKLEEDNKGNVDFFVGRKEWELQSRQLSETLGEMKADIKEITRIVEKIREKLYGLGK